MSRESAAVSDLFAHAVDDLQVLGVGEEHVRVHSDVVVQEGHHVWR